MTKPTRSSGLVIAGIALAGCSRGSESRAKPAPRSDGAVAAATAARAVQVALGDSHTCVLLDDGGVYCWGLGAEGRLGRGDTTSIGDDETSTGAVILGGKAIAIATGYAHTCALLDTAKVRCWGRAAQGQLGYGHRADVGDDEPPVNAGDVPVTEPVTAIAAGGNVTCVLLASNAVRCWGENREARLGYGGLFRGNLGDDEAIESMAAIRFSRRVAQLAVGAASTCVRFVDGAVTCWGWVTGAVDADDGPAVDTTDVEVGAAVAELALTPTSQGSCAITTGGHARCWGQDAALGYQGESVVGVHSASNIGNAPDDLGDLPLRGVVTNIGVSGDHGCALFAGGEVRCWGNRTRGLLGVASGGYLASKDAVVVDIGRPALALAVSEFHSCVITDRGRVRCWGLGKNGRLGYGSIDDVGDKQPPSAVGDVPIGFNPVSR